MGVWQLGLYKNVSDWTASQAAPFTSAALTFRYDQSRVKSHQTLTLYRHTGTEWVKVGGAPVTPDHCIATTVPLTYLSGADANIGWFTLAARDSGTVIMVQ
ncbi:MAG: hypothetical protein PHO37_10805 [Kiritimatiellae bacterium]|nr:hypothetical protein [Kiritimatiellia bacterium]